MRRQQAAFHISLIGIVLSACSAGTELKPFTSDGCSLFPDASLINDQDWCSCCFEHDLAYWRGGTVREREVADAKLRDCVSEKTNNNVLAALMHEGVKLGGSPYFYNWYRWGYGWNYDRKYQELSETETVLADKLEQYYIQSAAGLYCQI
jgi:hypothetical protein